MKLFTSLIYICCFLTYFLCSICFGYDYKNVVFLMNPEGDTIKVVLPIDDKFLRVMMVRIRGIDAPELHSKNYCERNLAFEAKKVVFDKLAPSEHINLRNVEWDKYARLLADVRVDGEDLGAYLVSHNYAVPYDGKTKQKVDWCRK